MTESKDLPNNVAILQERACLAYARNQAEHQRFALVRYIFIF